MRAAWPRPTRNTRAKPRLAALHDHQRKGVGIADQCAIRSGSRWSTRRVWNSPVLDSRSSSNRGRPSGSTTVGRCRPASRTLTVAGVMRSDLRSRPPNETARTARSARTVRAVASAYYETYCRRRRRISPAARRSSRPAQGPGRRLQRDAQRCRSRRSGRVRGQRTGARFAGLAGARIPASRRPQACTRQRLR